MPKARRRQKGSGGVSTGQSRVRNAGQAATIVEKTGGGSVRTPAVRNRQFLSPVVRGPQSLVFPGMIMAGCWLMAFTLIFFDTEANHNLLGGLAVLMALLWSFSFGIRLRKLLLRKIS